MKKVQVGSTDIRIAPIVFGGNIFGWTADEPTSFQLLDAFVDRGFDCVDTADVYSRFAGLPGGESETVIGNWLAQGGGRRDKIVLCTKVGLEMSPEEKGLSAAYIERAVEASLRRLKTDHVDIYFSHWDDASVPLEETLAAHDKLIKAGKVRVIGSSNYSADRLQEALDVAQAKGLPRYEVHQPLYSLIDRAAFEGPLVEVCRRNGLGVFTYFSLASGFLTGKYRKAEDTAGANREGFMKSYFNDRGMRILAAMDAVAARRGCSLVQLALAWLLAKPAVTAPIASATSLTQLDQVLGAVDVELTAEDMTELDEAGKAEG